MAKAPIKSESSKKEAVVAISKKSKSIEKKNKSLEKKISKKKLAIQSPDAKNGKIGPKKEKKNSEEVQTESAYDSQSVKKPKAKSGRFDKLKKIQKVMEEKKLQKGGDKNTEQDSDASEDEEDTVACKSYAPDFGLDEVEAAEQSNVASDSDVSDEEKEVEVISEKEKKTKKNKTDKSKLKNSKPENYINQDDPEDQARTVLMTNVNLKTSRKVIEGVMKKYGRIINVRFRNMPVICKGNSRTSISVQVKLRQFKKEATSCSVYVRFSTPEEATAALAANTTVIDDHHVFVMPVLPKTAMEKRQALAEGNQILVGNLPFSAEAEPLYKEFISCGNITGISIPRNKLGNCTGIAFIEFEDKDSVPLALRKDGAKLRGKEMRVTKAVRKVKKTKTGERKFSNPNPSPRNPKFFRKNASSDGAPKSRNLNPKKNKENKENSFSRKNKENSFSRKNKENSFSGKNKSAVHQKKKAGKWRRNKEDVKKLTIARKLAAKP